MCNQVQSVTLQTAVLMQVQEFAQNNTPFSVHDITRTIRQKTAQGELEIPEVEVQSASFSFDIPHPKVKALFDELWRTGVFDPNFTLSRQFNGMYFLYTPAPVNSGSVSVPAPAIAPSTPVFTAKPPVTSNSADSTVQARVQQYLKGCASRNFRPSLKQVQSAIKRQNHSTGWSCEALRAMITGIGYTVIDDPEAISRAQVATV